MIVAIFNYMQDGDGNEESTGIVKKSFNLIDNWKFRNPWIASLCNYFIIYHTDVDSARYMLSAIVQSQAAIVAIVITLTLIAVQLTASAYSPRVIEIFKKNPDMWILLGSYGLSMLYGLIILKMIEGVEGEVVYHEAIWTYGHISISFECCVSFVYWLEAFTIIALIPYMWNIINLLKSEAIIKRFAVKITEDSILNNKNDQIQPILDIIHGSVMKYDIATTRFGLETVTDRMIEIIHSDCEQEISGLFCNHLERIGKLTVSKEDGESAILVLENLESFGESTVQMKLENAVQKVALSLYRVGIVAAEKEIEEAAYQSVKSLRDIAKAAADKNLEEAASDATMFLGDVGKTAVEKELNFTALRAAEFLGAVGITVVENELKFATFQVVLSLGNVGKAAAENELNSAAVYASESLKLVGIMATEKKFLNEVSEAVFSLGDIGKTAIKKGLENAAVRTARSLANFTISSEEIINKAFQDNESRLIEKDINSFVKFKNMYKQELEKLRNNKSE